MTTSAELEARRDAIVNTMNAATERTAFSVLVKSAPDLGKLSYDAITALRTAEEELARVRKDALSLRRSLIDWRQREWPHTNQAEIIDRDYPSIAAIKEHPNV